MKKGHKVVSLHGTPACFVDTISIELDSVAYDQTVRTPGCQMLCNSAKCSCCKNYRLTLCSMCHRLAKHSLTRIKIIVAYMQIRAHQNERQD